MYCCSGFFFFSMPFHEIIDFAKRRTDSRSFTVIPAFLKSKSLVTTRNTQSLITSHKSLLCALMNLLYCLQCWLPFLIKFCYHSVRFDLCCNSEIALQKHNNQPDLFLIFFFHLRIRYLCPSLCNDNSHIDFVLLVAQPPKHTLCYGQVVISMSRIMLKMEKTIQK